jgi:hypothetical protein
MSGADARSLAERLAGEADESLARLFAGRGVAANVGWRDFFDAAEALLAPESVSAALRLLPRHALSLLSSGGPVPSSADVSLRVLTDADGRPLPPVVRAMSEIEVPPACTDEPPAADERASAAAAEKAFTTLSALADILISTMRAPLPRVGADGLGAAGRRRLVQEEIAQEAGELDDLVSLGAAAGLIRAHERHWLATAAGASWVREPTRRRWPLLVEGWRDALPDGLRPSLAGGRLGRGWIACGWEEAYPLDESWPAHAERRRRTARLAGLLTADGAEPPWATPARRGAAPDVEPLTALLPGEVDGVFLQNDLTAISPGPLRPELDVRLREMTVRESHAQASSYRFTEASVNAALSGGESAESMRAFLSELSITGIPQPLDYLIARASERHGLVRVSAEPGSGSTIVSSRDHQLVATIGVDQSLRALGLVAEGPLLRTRAARDVVYWALVDARYPVLALDNDGSPVALHRHRLAPEKGDDERLSRFAALIGRLRGAHGPDVETAWLERELEAAVRTRSHIVVEVEMPGGELKELTMEATGVGGGRLRGRSADVERTLPVSLIRSVRPA